MPEKGVKMADIKLEDKDRQPCEIWTRVMGYYRPVSAFNKGKQSECKDRKMFKEPQEDTLKSEKE